MLKNNFFVAGVRPFSISSRLARGQNLTEKITQRYAVGLLGDKKVHSGDYVTIKPAHCMSHDNSWPIATKFKGLGASKIHDNRQVVCTLDHDVQNKSEKNLSKYENIKNFAQEHGVDFYPAGRGIGHQVMIEEGYAFPLNLSVASDSHSNTYGGVGSLGTPIVRTDGAAIWATGRTWWQIPPVAKVELKGQLRQGVTGKDIIVALCGVFNQDEVLNHAIEFTGEGVASLPIDYRLTIANMTTEWGALSGLFPVDERLIHFYEQRVNQLPQPHPRINETSVSHLSKQVTGPDSDAMYAKHLSIDLSTLSPHVSGPNSVKVSTPLLELSKQHIPINKAYLVSCTNARLSDIQAAAEVVKGHKVADGVQFYFASASSVVQQEAEKMGYWQVLLDSGAIPLPSGCGPCIGLGIGLLEDGEVGISATNRNFKGRMGSREALAYLASPEVVAASAILGRIGAPEEIEGKTVAEQGELIGSVEIPESENADEISASDNKIDVLDDFPTLIEGELILCNADNVNTDGIYPGKYTYQDDVPRSKMAEVCMENYDAEFKNKTGPGDIIVSGYNFGTGSSREQAATAILARDMNVVVAGSFGNIFFRNSINNALLTLEIPALINTLRQRFGDSKELTIRTGWNLRWDVTKAHVTITDQDGITVLSQKVGELGTNLQEIIVKGGLEGWVKAQLSAA